MFSDYCLKDWTLDQLRNSIEFTIDTSVLTNFGWKTDECGNAWKDGYSYSNIGTLIVHHKKYPPLEIDEWIENNDIKTHHPRIHKELLTSLNIYPHVHKD